MKNCPDCDIKKPRNDPWQNAQCTQGKPLMMVIPPGGTHIYCPVHPEGHHIYGPPQVYC